MKLSRLLAGSFGLFALSSLAGCIVCGDAFVDVGETCDDGNFNNGDGCDDFCQLEEGSAAFTYVLLQTDPATGNIVATPDCATAGVTSVSLLIGNDPNLDGVLDDAEVVSSVTVGCNQFDTDGDGIIAGAELGLYDSGDNFLAGDFDLFAVEYLDANNTVIPWQTFDNNTNFTRFTFGAGVGISIVPNTTTNITFNGDAQQTAAGELQSFFGF